MVIASFVSDREGAVRQHGYALGLLVAWRVPRSLRRNLDAVTDHLDQLARDEINTKVETGRADEFGGVNLARLGDDAFELIAPRGFAESLWKDLVTMGLEFGVMCEMA